MRTPRRRRTGDAAARPTVISGELGDPGDDDRLSVTFRIEGSRVRLTSGEQELGAWPLDEVSMTPGGQSLWYFSAEGDRLPFVPTRPAALQASELGSEPDAAPAAATRRRSRRATATPHESISEPERTRGHASVAEPAAADPVPEDRAPSAPAPSRRTRRPVVADLTARVRIPHVRIRRRPKGAVTTDDARPPVVDTAPGVSPDKESLWLRTIDAARRQGLFGFDRLPVDESNRHGEHQHTWAHPAAASSGPAQYICTICGAIRR